MNREERHTARQRRVWSRLAPGYDDKMAKVERGLLAGSREWVGARVTGPVLEVAVGTGRSLPFYPPGTELVGVDLSPAMLRIARRRAADAGLAVELVEGDAEALPFGDAEFATVVCELALCSIPRPSAAIHEMARVLRPGGTLLLVDHIGSSWPPLYLGQWLIERFTIPAQGEHLTRRQLPLVEAAGLTVVERERLKAGMVERIRAVTPG
jgi:ubiquinone/menaquinone biosynthesis C-methylase UbiE